MKAKTTARAGCWCLLLITLTGASLVKAEEPTGSEALQERYLLAIDQEIQRSRRLLRREREKEKAGDAERLARLSTSRVELRRLEVRLESWEKKQELEPYRRNFPRFLRNLHSQLRRFREDLESLTHGDEAPRAEPGRAQGVIPERGYSAEEPMVPKQRPSAAEIVPERATAQLAVPANDDCGAATPIGDGIFGGNTESATNDGEASCGASQTAPDVWFHYTAATTGTVDFNTFGSSFDTVLSLHTSCPGTRLNELACNDDWNSLQSRLTYELTVGQEVMIRISGYSGDNGDFQLNVARPGQITGTVVDAETGMGLPGAYIDIYDKNGYWVAYDLTRASGVYSVADLSPGIHYAKASKSSFIPELYDDIECFDWCPPESGTPVIVQPSETVVVDFALTLGGTIWGTVTDAQTGQPLDDPEVSIYDESGDWIDTDWSDTPGTYVIEGLKSGIYYAFARSGSGYIRELYDDIPCAGYCNPTLGSPISVGTSESVQVDFSLQLGGSIAGTITDAQTGHFLRSVQVDIYDEIGRWVAYGWTDQMGTYAGGGLPSGTYHAIAERYNYVDELYDDIECPGGCPPTTGTSIAVIIGEVTTGIDFALDREGAITGIVLDEAVGVGVIACDVDVWNQVGDWVGHGYGDFWGNYTAGGLPAGTYHVTTDNDTGYLDELYENLPCTWGGCDPTTGTPIVVSTGMNTTGVDFGLAPGGSIAGSVIDVATGGQIVGHVEVWNTNGEQVGTDWFYHENYLLLGLPTGDYFVRTDVGPDYTDELYDGIFCSRRCDPTSGTAVGVVAGSTTAGIDFALCGRPVVEPHFPPSTDPDSFIKGCHVQIGGMAVPYHPACPAIKRIHWNWGDGRRSNSWMPASHWYLRGGGLVTVSVTAYDVHGGKSETIQGKLDLSDCPLRGVWK
jgi:hypothetical protein